MPPAKRRTYEAGYKIKVMAFAETHGNRAAGREFSINESMVRKWRKMKDALTETKKSRKSFRGNKARWPVLEEQVEAWVHEERAAGRLVSTVSIGLKAKTIADELQIKEFQGGPSWCFRFKRRKELATPLRSAEPRCEDDDHTTRATLKDIPMSCTCSPQLYPDLTREDEFDT
jgi:hypothetical protein